MEFAPFMSLLPGGLLRILAGLALVVMGLVWVTGIGGIILAMVGLAPLVAGLGNFYFFAPLFRGLFLAKDIKQD